MELSVRNGVQIQVGGGLSFLHPHLKADIMVAVGRIVRRRLVE
jgi:hypothetical protein